MSLHTSPGRYFESPATKKLHNRKKIAGVFLGEMMYVIWCPVVVSSDRVLHSQSKKYIKLK